MKRWSANSPEPRYAYDTCATCCYLGQVAQYDLFACEARHQFDVRWGSAASQRQYVEMRKEDDGSFFIPYAAWMTIPTEFKDIVTLALERMNDMHRREAAPAENKFAGALDRLNE